VAYRKINVQEYIGKRYGRLVITGRSLIDGHKGKGSTWDCLCDCGKTIQVLSGHLFDSPYRGKVRSCGCLHDDNSRRFRPKGETGAWKLYRDYQYNAKNRGLEFTLTFEDIKKISSSNCVYCGAPPTKLVKMHHCKSTYSNYQYNGIDRVDSSKGYIISNAVPCCFVCNLMKRNFPKKVFLKHIAIIFKRYEKEIDLNENLPDILNFVHFKGPKEISDQTV